MKPIVIAIVSLSLLGASRALAADMAVPPPLPPTAPSYYYPPPVDWTGIYLGINGGYDFGKSDWSNAGLTTNNFNVNGFLLGGTIGINYLTGSGVLFGVEGDVGWSTLFGQSSTAACAAVGVITGAACGTKSEWFSTARGRLGYVFINRFLVYGTAGAAIADLKVGLNPPGNYEPVGPQLGWTGGAGVEYAFSDSWTAKLEYLYVDLGVVTCSAAGNCLAASTASVTLKENIVRGGFNYKFTW
jgi:outer membrane immunogenic protein